MKNNLGVVRWCDGAAQGRPSNFDYSRVKAYCTCSECGWGCFDIFHSSIISLFFLSLSLGVGPI